MKNFKSYSFLILFLILFFPIQSFAVFEFSFDFGYDRQIYGVNRQDTVVSRNYSVGLSSYIFDLTAVDLNFSDTQDITSLTDRTTVAPGYDIVAQQNRVKTEVFGIGVKQMLAGRGSFLTPIISVGYAREFVTSSGDITVEDTTNVIQKTYYQNVTKQRINSVFGSFTLQLKLTERFSLKGSARTLFPAFEFNKARDNIKYLAGFSWLF